MSGRVFGIAALAAALLLVGCGELPIQDRGPRESMDLSQVPEPIPRWEPRSKYGNPESYSVMGQTYQVLQNAKGYSERGTASWYGEKFHGKYTSTREPYNMYAMTAAHKTLPLPTYARVTNLQNGRSVIVRINDRGPFHQDRIIDLSYAAASRLGIVETGTAPVEVQAIDVGSPPAPQVEVVAQPGFRADAPLATPIPLQTGAGAANPQSPKRTTQAAAIPAETNIDRVLYLQVGAFASRENAERLRTKLTQSETMSAWVHETPHRTLGMLYRVRIGPLSPAEVERITPRLSALGLGRPQAVPRTEVEAATALEGTREPVNGE